MTEVALIRVRLSYSVCFSATRGANLSFLRPDEFINTINANGYLSRDIIAIKELFSVSLVTKKIFS